MDKLLQMFHRLTALILVRMRLTPPALLHGYTGKPVQTAFLIVSTLHIQVRFDRIALVTGKSEFLSPIWR